MESVGANSDDIHFLLDKLETPIYSHDCFILVLLEQDWSNKLINVCLIIQLGKLLGSMSSHALYPIESAYLLYTLVLL